MRTLIIFLITSMLVLGCGTGEESENLPPMSTTGGGGSVQPQDTSTGGACACPPGEPGMDGVDGTSCSVAQTNSGALMYCTDNTSVELHHGADGSTGPRGEPGESIVGPAGPRGETGPMGPPGVDGQSIVGPMGPAGPRGETGAQGPAGPRGEDGVVSPSRLYTVTRSGSAYQGAGGYTYSAVCNPGDFVLTGGCSSGNTTSTIILASMPHRDPSAPSDSPLDRWYCYWQASNYSFIDALAVCVDMSP